MQEIKFEDIADQIVEAFNKIREESSEIRKFCEDEGGANLLPDFLISQCSPVTPIPDIYGSYSIKYFTFVALCGNKTGRIYTFALEKLLPHLFKKKEGNEKDC